MIGHIFPWNRWGWLAVGLSASGVWLTAPLHATATDRIDRSALATGFVEQGTEAVVFLDHLTGELQALVLGKFSGKFNAAFRTNVLADLNGLLAREKGADQPAGPKRRPGPRPSEPPPALIIGKNARFLVVTGLLDFRQQRIGQVQLGSSVIYVVELETGWMLAYGIPWNQNAANAGQPQGGNLMLLDARRLRAVQ